MEQRYNPFGFDRIKNFRLVCPKGLRHNTGSVFRTANFDEANHLDISKLKEVIRIKCYIDLRSHISDSEQTKAKRLAEKLSPDIKYINIGIANGLQPFDQSKIPEVKKYAVTNLRHERYRDPKRHMDFLGKYMKFICKYNGRLVRQVLVEMSKPENYPLAFGCHAGKDRTGLIASLVLNLCGVSSKDILDDYMMSNIGWGEYDSNTKTASVYEDCLNEVLEWIRTSHGSVENYCKHIGVRPFEANSIKTLCSGQSNLNSSKL